ncbi:MAG: SHD1 domain-containing protein [Planctomycetota bacterium]
MHRTVLAIISFVIWVSCCIFPIAATQAQSSPIATTRVGDRILELHAVIKKPFGPDFRDRILTFAEKPMLDQLNSELGITPWEKTRIQGAAIGNTLVLGFLLRNADGTLPAASLKTCSAFRAVFDTGEECRYWPLASHSPVQEVNNYSWDYRLAPLLVEIPPGAKSIKQLDGILLRTPSIQGTMEITKKEIGNTIGKDSGLVVFPFSSERVKDGFGIKLGFFREKKNTKRNTSSSTQTVLERLALLTPEPSFEYSAVLPDGTKKRANFVGSVRMSTNAEKEILVDARKIFKQMIADKTLEADEVRFVMSGNNAMLDFTAVGFNEISDISSLQIQYSIPQSGPVAERFAFNETISLEESGDKESINQWVSQLSKESAKPIADSFRNWSDTTGKFSVEAKLVKVTADSVQLEKADGQKITVPLSKLSVDDRNYLESRN